MSQQQPSSSKRVEIFVEPATTPQFRYETSIRSDETVEEAKQRLLDQYAKFEAGLALSESAHEYSWKIVDDTVVDTE
jgi:hypothetical protein